ncbi:MAG TPA: TadE family protein [Bryobacteraceae bacterium]|jgi:Flp pilus assembly protein TadG
MKPKIFSSLQRRKGQKGSSMVESALVLLTLLSMILFIVDMGRILLIQQYITERARATVRMAVVNSWDSTKAANYLVYNSITAPGGGGPGFMGLLTTQVTYSTLGTLGTDNYRLQIKVSGVPALVMIPFIAGTYTLAPITATLPAQSLGSTS